MGFYLGSAAECPDGWGDMLGGCSGFGIMQVDKGYHDIQGPSEPLGLEHIRQAVSIFKGYLLDVSTKFSEWKPRFVLKGAAVAYNSGVKNVQTINSMDVGTANNDYGTDVMSRAQWFLLNGNNCEEPACDVNNPHQPYEQTGGWTLRAVFIVAAIRECFPNTFYMSTYADDGDHGNGNAIDVFPGTYEIKATGQDQMDGDMLAEWLMVNAADLKIWYMIWYGKIWNIKQDAMGIWASCAETQRCYGGNDITQGHFDHIHISVLSSE
jgi:hypothetical protein